MGGSLWLRSAELAVEVRPDKGADIASIVDVPSGTELLFQAPWGRSELASAPTTGESQIDWLARYAGGWQQLVPNAGAARLVDGVARGYHGEAAIVGWDVLSSDEAAVTLQTELTTAPLQLMRELRLVGATLTAKDTIRNTSEMPVPVMWVQHPGFGAPFIDEHCVVRSGAREFISDAEAPGISITGTSLAADARSAWPRIALADGTSIDLTTVPGPGAGRAVFGCLTDFAEAWFSIESPTTGFGIRVEWDSSLFRHAWFWQECHASGGFPWYRRAYVIAVEPANVIPGDPSPGCHARGVTPMLAGSESWTSVLTLRRTALR